MRGGRSNRYLSRDSVIAIFGCVIAVVRLVLRTRGHQWPGASLRVQYSVNVN